MKTSTKFFILRFFVSTLKTLLSIFYYWQLFLISFSGNRWDTSAGEMLLDYGLLRENNVRFDCTRSVSSYAWRNDTHGHLSAFAVVFNVDMLIVGAPAPGVTGVAETTRLIDFAVAAKGLIVVGADFATRIDLLVAELHANALGRILLRDLKSEEISFFFLFLYKRKREILTSNFKMY